jgi:hypothetical protein
MGRRMTLRGIIPVGSLAWTNPIRLQLANGTFTKNFKVVEFDIFPNMNRKGGTNRQGSYSNATSNTDLMNVCLALEKSAFTSGEFRFNDSRQIGWFQGYGHTTPDQYRSFLDPNHIIVQDLWLGAYGIDMQDGSSELTKVPLNYHIIVEEVSSSMNEAVLQLIKEQSQD